jgi:hypothetical protein
MVIIAAFRVCSEMRIGGVFAEEIPKDLSGCAERCCVERLRGESGDAFLPLKGKKIKILFIVSWVTVVRASKFGR